MLSNGEHVWTDREVRGAGGHREVERLRKAARRGLPGFAFGGPVADMDQRRSRAALSSGLRVAADGGLAAVVRAAIREALKREGTGAFNPGLAGALAFARAQVGDPYGWGASGPNQWDCSGFMGGLAAQAKGLSPYRRYFSTGTFPTSWFTRGMGAFTVGSTRDAGGGIGHMAGTINGVNVESRGGEGVVVGPRARGASNSLFGGNVWHLKGFARGGAVLPGDPPFDLLSPRGRRFRPDLADMLSAVTHSGHLAMSGGGVIREPVLGIGRSGRSYSFAENGPETVTPGRGGVTVVVNLNGPVLGNAREIARQLAPELEQQLRDRQRRTGRAVTV
jgi:hypothetical protein